MAGFAVDGLVSGLDTTSMINQLMQVEAAPQTLLKNKSTEASTLVSALQALNTKTASLAESASKVAGAEAWNARAVSSSAESVTATATGGAAAGALDLRVTQLARGQVSLFQSSAFAVAGPLTITGLGDEPVTITPASGSITDIAAAINAAGSGVSAAAVRVADDQYVLQLSGPSGSASSFELHAGTSKDDALVPGQLITAAQDAEVVLWEGTDAQKVLSSATNTFSGVLTGVDFTANAVTPEDSTVTLSVAPDRDVAEKAVKDLFASVSVVLSEITSRSATTTTTSSDGRTVVTGGLFSGDSSIRFLADGLRSAFSLPVEGRSPSEVGITLDRSGKLSLDEPAFKAAMAEDPAGTQALVRGLAERVADVATSASDPHEGTLTGKITSQEGIVRDLNTQVEDWDRRLETRRAGLQRTYSGLEVMLSQLQSQGQWLSGQLAGLPSWNNSNKS